MVSTNWGGKGSIATVITLLLAMGGCGDGGGNGSKATPTPTTPPVVSPTPTPTVAAAMPGEGMLGTIDEASVDPQSGEVSVVFTLTDEQGVPVEPVLGRSTDPNQARVRFVLAHVESYDGGGDFGNEFTRYVNDIDETRPAYDSGGALEVVDAEAGVNRYVFNTHLPEGFDAARTYSVGMQADRAFEGEELSANPVFDFVPAGGDPVVRAGSATQRCNLCHDPLTAHGSRHEFRLCTLCHTEEAVDEMGDSIAFRVMLHKIHRGRDLPSIVDGPPGTTYGIFSGFLGSEVVFAEKDENGVISGVAFPRDIRDCETCHAEGPTAEYHETKPSAAACSSCHDDVNPSQVATEAGPPGTNHFQNRGYPDGDCSFCHKADTGVEFDVSVTGAHVIPERSSQLEGLNVEITGLSGHAAGQAPTIRFRVTDDAGTPLTDLSGLNRLAFTASGPTSDYAEVLSSTAAGGGAGGMLSGPDGSGVFDYMPAFDIPVDASGTWALGAEARRSVNLETPEGGTVSVNEAAVNPVVTFAVDDSAPEVRRMVVEDANCQSCHGEFSRGFSIHGNLRNRVEYCVLCHNPNATDVSRRRNDPEAVAAGDDTATIDFKVMIHKIHRGEELEQKPYIIYGFGTPPTNYTIHDFAEVLFPGDLRDCQTCHIPGTYLIPPFPGPALGTLMTHLDPETGMEVIDGRLGPITAVCTSCHDGDAALAHAESQTASNGNEACAVCHAEGRDVAVSEEHAE